MKASIVKRIIALIAVSAMLVSLYVGTSVSAEADFSKSAADFASQINVGWNLGNTLDVAECWGGETGWGNPVTTKQHITAIKEKGFNAIRIPVTWYGRKSVATRANNKI